MRDRVTLNALCAWCGNRPARFRYFHERDDRAIRESDKPAIAFCCKECWQDYNS